MLLLDTNILIDVLRGEAIALESVRLRQRHGIKIPDAIILATARCAPLKLATRNSRDFPLTLGGASSLPALKAGGDQPAQISSRFTANSGKWGSPSRRLAASIRRDGAGGPARGSASGSQISTARSAGINSQPRRAPLRW